MGAICRRAADAGLVASGSFSSTVNEIAVGNSHGVFAYAPGTVADLSTVIMGDSGSGYADRTSMDVSDIDADAVGQEAVEKALRSRNPAAIEPGAYDVVLEEYAVAEMLDYLAFIGFGALAVQEGRSFMRLGETITGPNINIVDDASRPAQHAPGLRLRGRAQADGRTDQERRRDQRGLRQLHRRARTGPDKHRPRACPPPTPTAPSRSTCAWSRAPRRKPTWRRTSSAGCGSPACIMSISSTRCRPS